MSNPISVGIDYDRHDATMYHVSYCSKCNAYTEISTDGLPVPHLHPVDAQEAAAEHNLAHTQHTCVHDHVLGEVLYRDTCLPCKARS